MVIAALMGSAAFASAQTILIDFGSAASPTSDLGWNNITDGTAVDTPVALVDSTGDATGISATVAVRFNGANGIGYAAGTGDFPSSATNDSLFGNTGEFAGVSAPNPTIEFSGLNTEATYDFELYASRTGVSDDRIAPPPTRFPAETPFRWISTRQAMRGRPSISTTSSPMDQA